MSPPIVSPEVLRRMLVERVEAAHRGEVTPEFLRGYVIAMFHAGAISLDESRSLMQGQRGEFELTPAGEPPTLTPDP